MAESASGSGEPEVRVLKQQLSTHRRSQKDYVPTNITLKCAIVGPSKSGKSWIANQLAGVEKADGTPYESTVGVRILEFDENIEARNADSSKSALLTVRVELWDAGGDHSFEGCWPAIADNVQGVLCVFDPRSLSQSNEVRLWCEWYAKQGRLSSSQVLIVANSDLNNSHKPITVRTGDTSTITVPIININAKTKQQFDESGQLLYPYPSVTQFRDFLGQIFRFHPHADFDSLS